MRPHEPDAVDNAGNALASAGAGVRQRTRPDCGGRLAVLHSRALAIGFFGLLSAVVASAHAVGLLWEDQVDTGGDEAAQSVAVEGNRLFVLGFGGASCDLLSFPGDCDVLLRAYDKKRGVLLWEEQFDNAGGFDNFGSMAVHDGRVFTGGWLAPDPDGFEFVAAIRTYDAETGALLWEDRVEPGGFFDLFWQLATDGERLFAIGNISNAPGFGDFLLRAYDVETGLLLWEDQFDNAGGFDIARTVATGLGRVFVGGAVDSGVPGDFGDFVVRAHDAETGALLWEDQVDRGEFDEAIRIVVESGRVFAVGTAKDTLPDKDFLVRALDARTGALLWEDQVDKGGGADVAWRVAARGNRVFVVGHAGRECTRIDAGNCDYLVRAYNARNGELLWEDRVDKAGTDDVAMSVAVGGSRVYVGGFGGPGCSFENTITNCDILLRAYDIKTGALIWEDQVDKAGADDVLRFALVASGGRVFLAGDTWTPDGNADLLVRAYGADGEDDDSSDANSWE